MLRSSSSETFEVRRSNSHNCMAIKTVAVCSVILYLAKERLPYHPERSVNRLPCSATSVFERVKLSSAPRLSKSATIHWSTDADVHQSQVLTSHLAEHGPQPQLVFHPQNHRPCNWIRLHAYHRNRNTHSCSLCYPSISESRSSKHPLHG